MSKKNITLDEVADLITNFAMLVDHRFSKLEGEFVDLKKTVANLPTKDYLDVKISDLRAELITLTHGEDTKYVALVETLFKKNILTKQETKQLLRQQPFGRAL